MPTTKKSKYSGLEISKTLLFRILTHRAAGFIGKPLLLLSVATKALDRTDSDTTFKSVAKGALENIKSLIRLTVAFARGDYREVSQKNLILVVASILYFISPIDIIPDFIPVIGWLDDITLMGWVFKTLGDEITKFEDWEESSRSELESLSYNELYRQAQDMEIPGRSGMSKDELSEAIYNVRFARQETPSTESA